MIKNCYVFQFNEDSITIESRKNTIVVPISKCCFYSNGKGELEKIRYAKKYYVLAEDARYIQI